MDAFQIVSLLLLLTISTIHLVFCFLEKEYYRKITKCFILPFIIVFLMALKCDSILLYLGLAFGTIGDAFLLNNKNEKFFLAGLLSFFVGHFLYIYSIIKALSYEIPYYVYIIGFVTLGLIILLSYKMVLNMIKKKLLIIPMIIYSFVLGILVLSSFLLLIDQTSKGSIILFIGALLFIVTDLILTFVTFLKDFKRRDFYIMITYILAEIGIVLGLFFII